jgi:hypothetical protein
MSVKTVVGKIDLTPGKPLRPRRIPVEHFVPLLEPVKITGGSRPESLRRVHRLAVQPLIFLKCLNVRLLAELFWTLELALLLKYGIDATVRIRIEPFICHQ